MVEKRMKRLSLHGLIKEREEIWVKNKTGSIDEGIASGVVVFWVGKPGMGETVYVPPGADPVCITDQVPISMLEDCMDLPKLIRDGALELLDPQEALDFYEKNKDRKSIIEKKLKSIRSKKDFSEELMQTKAPKQTGYQNVNPRVRTACRRGAAGKLGETAVLEELIEVKNALKEDDYEYILKKGHFDAVISWAEEEFDKFKKRQEKKRKNLKT